MRSSGGESEGVAPLDAGGSVGGDSGGQRVSQTTPPESSLPRTGVGAAPSPPTPEADDGGGAAQAPEAWRRLVADADARLALERAVAWEEKAVKGDTSPGWEPGQVPVPPPIMRRFKNAAIVKVYYSSNRYTDYVLLDRAVVVELLAQRARADAAGTSEDVPAAWLAEFERLAHSGDAVAALVPSVAPEVVGLERQKAAVLLQLASVDDEGGDRGRIHVLLHGPRGTAKSRFLEWSASVAGVEVFGTRTSGAGLTVDQRTGGPGAMPLAHGTEFALVIVDEVEKVDAKTMRHTLQALEEGRFTSVAAGSITRFDASVRFLGAANEIGTFPLEFLDRIDFLLSVPALSREAAKAAIGPRTRGWMRPGHKKQSIEFVRAYLRWARARAPGFDDAERDSCARIQQALVDQLQGSSVQMRSLEAVYRVAFALARLERADVTTPRVLRAVRLLFPELDERKMTLIHKAAGTVSP